MAESATIVGVRTRKHPLAMKTIQEYFIGADQIAGILDFEEGHVKEAWALFLKTNAEKKTQIISFIDCTNVILCQHYSIDTILAFDRHFEGYLTRIF